MAFQLYNWSEVSTSLNQGLISAAIQTETSDTTVLQGAMNLFSYYSPTDSIATILAADYFDVQVFNLQPYDIIFVTGSDYSTILQVATVTLPVPGGSTGQVTTGLYQNSSLVEAVTTVTLSNAQLLGMYATPVLLVPAQGANNMIIVDKVIVDYHYLTAATAAGGAIAAQYGSAANGAGPAASASIAAATLNGFSGSAIMAVGQVAVSQLDAAVENVGVYISNATAAFTTGAGSATVYTYYRSVTLA